MKNMPLDPSVDPTPPVEQPQYDIVVEFLNLNVRLVQFKYNLQNYTKSYGTVLVYPSLPKPLMNIPSSA
jgi:hypothetical protein